MMLLLMRSRRNAMQVGAVARQAGLHQMSKGMSLLGHILWCSCWSDLLRLSLHRC
jgi:hypothetical protein